jgi:CheY-like chemotaxis protein
LERPLSKRDTTSLNKEEDTVALGTGTVLLLDDDEIISKLTTEMLHDLGYTVETVTRGEKAVELYRLRKEEGSPFDAVILDLYQPDGIGGEETMKRLLEYDSGVKAIASSGFVDDKTIIDPKAYGFRGSLPKPYDMSQLRAVLQEVIDWEDRRKDVRHGIIANFSFVVGGGSDDMREGITINISKNGFGFLTDEAFEKGQDIVVTKHDVPKVAGRKAKVAWVKKGPVHYSAGVEFVTA